MVYTLTETSTNNYTLSNDSSKNYVTLVTSDNNIFKIADECAVKMITIKNCIGDTLDGDIPVPNVNGKQMIAILKFIIIDMEQPPIPEIDVTKVQVPPNEDAQHWIDKAKRENMRKHAISIPKEIWHDDLAFLNNLVVKPGCKNLECPGGPADYLEYENFCYAWGKTMGEQIQNITSDEARNRMGLLPSVITRPKINEYEEEEKDADGNIVMETVTVWN